MSLLNECKFFQAVTTTAGEAGVSTITSSAVDTAGYDRVTFVVFLGTIVSGAVTSLKVQQSSDDAATDTYDDLTGSAQTIADTDDDHIRICEIIRPQKRYLKMVISRSTQNATIGGVVAILGGAKGVKPITQATASVIGSEAFNAPAEGTA